MKIKNEDLGLNTFFNRIVSIFGKWIIYRSIDYMNNDILEKESDYKIISNNKKYIEDLKTKRIELVLDSEIKDEKVKQFLISLKR